MFLTIVLNPVILLLYLQQKMVFTIRDRNIHLVGQVIMENMYLLFLLMHKIQCITIASTILVWEVK